MNPFFNEAARDTVIGDLNTGAATFVTVQNAELARLLAIPNPTEDDLAAIAAIQAALAADPQGFRSFGIQDLNGDGAFDRNDIDGMDAQENEATSLFEAFRSVGSEDYFDLMFGYTYKDMARLSLLVVNVFDEDPPILGNNTGSTSFNSGNTFPSLYDTLGRTWSANVKFMF